MMPDVLRGAAGAPGASFGTPSPPPSQNVFSSFACATKIFSLSSAQLHTCIFSMPVRSTLHDEDAPVCRGSK